MADRPRRRGLRAGLAVVLGILAIGGLLAGLAFRGRIAGRDPIADARAAYARQDWSRAAELARARLKAAPDDEAALRLLARSAIRQGRDDSGISIYGDRIGTGRMEPEDFFLLGLTLQRQGNVELARSVWTRAAGESSVQPELLTALADLQVRAGRLDEAAALATRLTAVPGWEAVGSLVLGTARSALGDHRGAVETLSRGLELDSGASRAPLDLPSYRKMLARSLLSLGRAAEADRQLEPLLAPGTGTGDLEAHWLASRAALQQGQIDRARAELARSGSYRDDHPLTPEPSPFAGAARCVPCHSEASQAHEATRHARTFHHGKALLALPRPEGPLSDPDDPRVLHTLSERDGKLRMQTRRDDRIREMVIDYAFGTADRYVTMVGRDEEGTFRALRRSFYHADGKSGWDRTSGDVGDPDPAERVRGQRIDVRDGVVRCLHCHVTNPREFRDPEATGTGPEAADSGIGCERCHGPGVNHIRAVEAELPDRAIVTASRGGAESVLRQCRECHIVGDASEMEHRREEPIWVRSPGATLAFSRCYTESAGGLSCLTCHDPHRDSERSAGFYEKQCLACHSASPGPAPDQAGRALACKVNPARDCLSCHMPKVPVPVLHTSLTDHYIRVHRTP